MNQAIAHTVKTSSDVAATFHLEPNHNPKAGEVSTVWFALTKAGGQPIPLEECNCQLEVKQAEQPIAAVTLKPISAEQYQGIPGGEVVFPQVGIYQLIFSGSAKDGDSFRPFELQYDVTVQPGRSTTTATAPIADPSPATTRTTATNPAETAPVAAPSAQPSVNPLIMLGLMGGAILLLAIGLARRNAQ